MTIEPRASVFPPTIDIQRRTMGGNEKGQIQKKKKDKTIGNGTMRRKRIRIKENASAATTTTESEYQNRPSDNRWGPDTQHIRGKKRERERIKL